MELRKMSVGTVLAAAVCACTLSTVRADSVNLNTVTNLLPLSGTGWFVSKDGGTPVGVVEIANNPGGAWAHFGVAGDGQWVSNDSTSGNSDYSDPNKTTYDYSIAFSLPTTFSGDGVFSLNGDFFTDNFATSVTLTANGNPISITTNPTPLPESEDGYKVDINVNVPTGEFEFGSSTAFVLTISTINEWQPGSANDQNNVPAGPEGFEFTGSATANPLSGGSTVPTPKAAWMGLSLIGGIGGVSMLRKRRHIS